MVSKFPFLLIPNFKFTVSFLGLVKIFLLHLVIALLIIITLTELLTDTLFLNPVEVVDNIDLPTP